MGKAADKLLKQLEEKNAEALAMGGPQKLAQRKAEGHLNARERIDYLVDPGTFAESGRHARAIRAEVGDPERLPRSLTLHYLYPPSAGDAERV